MITYFAFGLLFSFYCLLFLKLTYLLFVAEEKVLMYEKKLAIYEEIIKKCEASKAGVTSTSSTEKKKIFFSARDSLKFAFRLDNDNEARAIPYILPNISVFLRARHKRWC